MKKLFDKFRTEVYILVGVLVAWKAWPIISPLFSLAGNITDTVAKGAAGATANLQATSQLAIDQAALRSLWPGASEAQIAELRSDAKAMASYLGTLYGKYLTMTRLFADQKSAFALLKSKYSRVLLRGNTPFDKATLKSTVAETHTSAHRLHNYAVLQPFYAEYTGGNSLKGDVRRMLFGNEYQQYLQWIL
jgi:hypothetical protein